MTLFEILLMTKDVMDRSDYNIVYENIKLNKDLPIRCTDRRGVMVIPSSSDSAAVISMAKRWVGVDGHSSLDSIFNACVSRNIYLNIDEKIEHYKLAKELILATIKHPNLKVPNKEIFGHNMKIDYYLSFYKPDISQFVLESICSGADVSELYEAINILVYSCLEKTKIGVDNLCCVNTDVSYINDDTMSVVFNNWNLDIGDNGSDVFRAVKDLKVTSGHFERYIEVINRLTELYN